MEIYINFGGFYGSRYEGLLESIEDSLIDEESPEDQELDYTKVYDLYSKEIVNFFNEEFKTNVKFVELSSPKEYNFYTDKIVVEAEEKDLKKILRKINKDFELKDEVLESVKQATTMRDGYIPYYDKEEVLNDIALLSNVAIKTWFDEVGTELFTEKKYERLQDVLFTEDVYKENEDLSLNR